MTKAIQNVLVPFGAGMDQKTDPRALMPGQWTSIINGQLSKNGRLTQRNGYSTFGKAISTGGNVAAPVQKLISNRSEMNLIDANAAMYSAQSSGPWSLVGQCSEATVARSTVYDGVSSQQSPDVAISGAYTVRCWVENVSGSYPNFAGDLVATISDTTTGALISGPTRIATTNVAAPRVQILNGVAMIVWYDSTGPVHKQTHATLGSNPTWSAPASIAIANQPYNAVLDFITIPSQSSFILAFPDNDQFLLVAVNTSGAVINNHSFAAANLDKNAPGGCFAVAIAPDPVAGGILCAYTGVNTALTTATAATFHSTWNGTTFTLDWGPTQLPAGIKFGPAGQPNQFGLAYVSSSVAMVTQFSGSTATNTGLYCTAINATSGASVGPLVFTPILSILSRPFLWNGTIYAMAYWGQYAGTSITQSIQGTLFFVAVGNASGAFQVRPVSTIAPRIVPPSFAGFQRVPSSLANVPSLSFGTFNTIAAAVTDGQYPSGRTSLMKTAITFRDPQAYQASPIAEDLAIGAGVPALYDGARVSELGFLTFPEIDSTNFVVSNVGGSMAAGAYNYALVYEYIDARGLRHWSAPSNTVGVTTTGAGTSKVTINAPTLSLTTKGVVSIVVYRSVVGGSTLFRVTPDESPTANRSVYGQTFITIQDTAADNTISSNPLLYTTGGELPNFCPPNATISCVHRSRLFLAGTDEGRTIWFSKYLRQGFGPGFNDALTIYLGSGEAVTGMASMDDKLVVFKRDRIFVIFGDGPPDTGVGSDWQIQTISSDIGCTSASSVVVTPDGVMFMSQRGLMLLSRGLDVVSIGLGVEDITTLAPLCTSATLIPEQNQVRFTMADSGSINGPWPVYDYVQKQWVEFIVRDSDNGGTTGPAGGSCYWNGAFRYAGQGGMVYTESASAGFDGSNANLITMSATSAHIKTGGIAGFQRIRRIQVVADVMTNALIQLVLFNNYSNLSSQTLTFTSGLAQVESVPVIQKCEAIQFVLACVASSPETSGSPQLIGVEMECVTDTRISKTITPSNRM